MEKEKEKEQKERKRPSLHSESSIFSTLPLPFHLPLPFKNFQILTEIGDLIKFEFFNFNVSSISEDRQRLQLQHKQYDFFPIPSLPKYFYRFPRLYKTIFNSLKLREMTDIVIQYFGNPDHHHILCMNNHKICENKDTGSYATVVREVSVYSLYHNTFKNQIYINKKIILEEWKKKKTYEHRDSDGNDDRIEHLLNHSYETYYQLNESVMILKMTVLVKNSPSSIEPWVTAHLNLKDNEIRIFISHSTYNFGKLQRTVYTRSIVNIKTQNLVDYQSEINFDHNEFFINTILKHDYNLQFGEHALSLSGKQHLNPSMIFRSRGEKEKVNLFANERGYLIENIIDIPKFNQALIEGDNTFMLLMHNQSAPSASGPPYNNPCELKNLKIPYVEQTRKFYLKNTYHVFELPLNEGSHWSELETEINNLELMTDIFDNNCFDVQNRFSYEDKFFHEKTIIE